MQLVLEHSKLWFLPQSVFRVCICVALGALSSLALETECFGTLYKFRFYKALFAACDAPSHYTDQQKE